MAVLFVSHSSKDDTAVNALEAWLRVNGFTDIFVDHESLAGGANWREELRASAGACRVVLCLVTENWLASYECFNEFRAAWYMGKRIIPLLLLPPVQKSDEEAAKRFAEVCAEYQGVDLKPCLKPDGALDVEADANVANRLKVGLRAAGALGRVGLDPEAFEIDRKLRPTPFPGLASFGDDDADAALFYGRSREIAQAMDALRQMRAAAERRPFVILGASGAGKSPLLKAGIIPRLRREAPAWLPLRAFRPGADPLLNFAEAWARSFADFGKREAHGVIRDRLFEAWSKAERATGVLTRAGHATVEAALEAEGRRLRDLAGRSTETILISIDQAEETARADGDSGEALADYLRAALVTIKSSWQLAFTIRTDSFPELQRHPRFQALEARGYDLRAIPVFRFDSVVEEPAKRYGVEVDDRFIEGLTDEAPHEDALPLLAFALQRLWNQYAASGALTRDNYDKVGGLKGLIEDAAERALRGLTPEDDVALPAVPPAKRLIDLAAACFVPALAQVNDQGATIRRIATWNSFDEGQQELLTKFDQWRLVVRKGDPGTVEVAHEALFREWTRLESWLEPERARLEALRSLQVDAANWNRNSKDAAFLNHRDKRLAEARALASIDGYRKRLSELDLEYLEACQVADRLHRNRTRRMQALVGVLAFSIVAGLAGWLNGPYLYALERVNWFATMRPYMLEQVRPYVLSAEAERALKPMDSFRECAKDCPEMVVIPAGEFTMGSPDTEKDRDGDEGPQHKVSIGRSFAASKYDVTFADWDACVSVGGCREAHDLGLGRGTKPIINVSWEDAQQYVAWLSRVTGQPYRLLTEAEWEYAGRAGTTTAYSWGDEIGKGNADCDGCGSAWDKHEPSPVGSFKPNAFGLYDMSGDVFQWVQDCYHKDFGGAPADGSAWTGGECNSRVVRGGSWFDNPQDIRIACRVGNAPEFRDKYIGFRVGRTLIP